MNKITLALAGVALTLPLSAFADGAPAGNTLSSTMDVYVFPTEGQETGQQSQDESECYQWAVSNSGSDPFELADKAESDQQQADAEMAAAQQTGQGAGARGVLRGAAAGAIVGEIADNDVGRSAAIGAAAVGVRGRRKGKAAQSQATAQAEQQAATREQATAEDLENFKNAFGVCLEAKDYMVKF
jgi:hypothetical protein